MRSAGSSVTRIAIPRINTFIEYFSFLQFFREKRTTPSWNIEFCLAIHNVKRVDSQLGFSTFYNRVCNLAPLGVEWRARSPKKNLKRENALSRRVTAPVWLPGVIVNQENGLCVRSLGCVRARSQSRLQRNVRKLRARQRLHRTSSHHERSQRTDTSGDATTTSSPPRRRCAAAFMAPRTPLRCPLSASPQHRHSGEPHTILPRALHPYPTLSRSPSTLSPLSRLYPPSVGPSRSPAESPRP